MGSTPTYAWPYPEGADPPRGDQQIRALAEAVETDVLAIVPQASGPFRILTGQTTRGTVSTSGDSTTVTFTPAFSAAPIVLVGGASDSTLDSRTHYHAEGVTAGGFTLRRTGDAGTQIAQAHWLAIGPA